MRWSLGLLLLVPISLVASSGCNQVLGTSGYSADIPVGSSGSSSGGSTMVCGGNFKQVSCANCIQANCCNLTETCFNDQACVNYVGCVAACASGDTTCENACTAAAMGNAVSEADNTATCWSSMCSSAGC